MQPYLNHPKMVEGTIYGMKDAVTFSVLDKDIVEAVAQSLILALI